ncbi:MAG: hypothetical protein KDC90_10710 [Ignavibacteriae bacterium]|nr:hypothetical protein [Ignavibacteriota bacterium]
MYLYTLIKIISEGSPVNKAKEKVLYEQAKSMPFNSYEYDLFLQRLDPISLKRELSSFNDNQKDFAVAMTLELLTCNGVPSERDYMVAENAFEKIMGMNSDDFLKRLEKIQSIGKFFSK